MTRRHLHPKMPDLPSELLREIFLRLPAVSLIRFRAVCKAWYYIIDDPSFVKSHTNNQQSSNTLLIRNKSGSLLYSLNLHSLNFTDGLQTIPVTPVEQLIHRDKLCVQTLPVAACNGLLLITYKDGAIWNPLTHECLHLPRLSDSLTYVEGSGLGYVSAADDYRVVMIIYGVLRDGKRVRRTHIYSLKSDSWKIAGNCPGKIVNIPSVHLNGKLYWRSNDVIIVFDLGTENYEKLQLPPVPTKGADYILHLDALGGCLFLSYYFYPMNCFELWVKDDNGGGDEWMRLFSFMERDEVCDASDLRAVAYLKSKRQVFLQADNGLFWLDIGSDSVKKVGIYGVSSSQICPGSLFRLHENCGVNSKRRASRKWKSRKMKMADSKLTLRVKSTGFGSYSHDDSSTSGWSHVDSSTSDSISSHDNSSTSDSISSHYNSSTSDSISSHDNSSTSDSHDDSSSSDSSWSSDSDEPMGW